MSTKVERIPVNDTTPLDRRIEDLCDIRLAQGYRLAAFQIVDQDVLLVFQEI